MIKKHTVSCVLTQILILFWVTGLNVFHQSTRKLTREISTVLVTYSQVKVFAKFKKDVLDCSLGATI